MALTIIYWHTQVEVTIIVIKLFLKTFFPFSELLPQCLNLFARLSACGGIYTICKVYSKH